MTGGGTPVLVQLVEPVLQPSRLRFPPRDLLEELFEHLAESFSDCTSYEFELLEAEVLGDAAYAVGLEHTRLGSTRCRAATPCA